MLRLQRMLLSEGSQAFVYPWLWEAVSYVGVCKEMVHKSAGKIRSEEKQRFR